MGVGHTDSESAQHFDGLGNLSQFLLVLLAEFDSLKTKYKREKETE